MKLEKMRTKGLTEQCFRVLLPFLGLAPWVAGQTPGGSVQEGKAGSYFLSVGEWEKYQMENPEVIMLPVNQAAVLGIVRQADGILFNLFNARQMDLDQLVVERFQADLDDLKLSTPDVGRGEGSVQRTGRRRFYHTFDGTIHYWSDSYTQQVSQNSDPDMIRRVNWTVANLTLQNLGSRIGGLGQTHSRWVADTAAMGNSGTVGARKKANEVYLSRLADYIKELQALEQEMQRYRLQLQRQLTTREETLKRWNQFERTKLQALKIALEDDSLVRYPLAKDFTVEFDKSFRGHMPVLKYEISGRQVFFDFHPEKLHPYQLILLAATASVPDDPFE